VAYFQEKAWLFSAFYDILSALPGLISFIFLCRSFAPILKLISGCDTPAIHHWATWALANLCNVDREFVCASPILTFL